MTGKKSFGPKCHRCVFFIVIVRCERLLMWDMEHQTNLVVGLELDASLSTDDLLPKHLSVLAPVHVVGCRSCSGA